MEKKAAKRGRPPKPKSERAPTVNFTMRLRPTLLEELRSSAEAHERSISAEAERRLSQPQIDDVGRMVSLVIASTEQREGKSWQTDISTRNKCRLAVDLIINTMLGPPFPLEKLKELVTRSKAYEKVVDAGREWGVLESLLVGAGPVVTAEGLRELSAGLSEAAEIQANAEQTLQNSGWGKS